MDEFYRNCTCIFCGWDSRRGAFFTENSLSVYVTALVSSTRTGEQVVINSESRVVTPIKSYTNGAQSEMFVMQTVGPFTKMQTFLEEL